VRSDGGTTAIVQRWHLVTGEYKPTPGGVADYVAILAKSMAEAGVEVHVWAPGDAVGPEIESGGVSVHRVAGWFGPAGLALLNRELNRFAGPRMILVQYVPHAFGWKAMNLPFAAWAAWRARLGDEVRVMFHEVAYPWVGRPLRHNVIAAANRVMAALLLRACTRAYVSIPGWIPLLRRLGAGRVPILWTPVPSNVPYNASPLGVESRRAELTGGRPAALVVGHFGTYGSLITRSLAPIFNDLLERRPDVRVLLLGNGGDRWRLELAGERTEWLGRIISPGFLSTAAIGDYLQSCDLMVQPYPDGVSCRRTTVMAALANGVAVLTTFGMLSEPIWKEGSVALFPANDVSGIVELAGELLDSPGRRAELVRAGRRLYEDRFAIGHTVAALLDPQ
jgi:glycosyltransferase involved in cell wall biosynthesis